MKNYFLETEKIIAENRIYGKKRLLLHSCCGPCSSWCIEYLKDAFEICVLYYNPNIFPSEEYEKRKAEQLRLISEYNALGYNVGYIDCDYDHSEFLGTAAGYENCLEGGERCHRCYEQRLRRTAILAKDKAFDYFCTTLTVSPYKNAETINSIGKTIEEEICVKFLPSDFKKKNGYLNSINISKKYSLYRQNYCGCEFTGGKASNIEK